MLNEEYEDLNLRSATDPVRRLKYKTEDDKRRKKWWNFWGKGKYEEENDQEERTAGHEGPEVGEDKPMRFRAGPDGGDVFFYTALGWAGYKKL